jgi:hypothetical protein
MEHFNANIVVADRPSLQAASDAINSRKSEGSVGEVGDGIW